MTMLLALLLAAVPEPASQKAEVLAAVDAFLDAINSGGRADYERVLHADGMTFSMRYIGDPQGLRVRTNRQTIDSIDGPSTRYTERYWNPTVLVHRDIAQFWAPYSFDIDGKRSHCGVDSFSLAKVDGKWIVTNLSYTVEPPARCAGLGEPKK